MASENPLTSIELFTGAGGLALGASLAGFKHLAVVEWNKHACESLRANSNRIEAMGDWPVFEQDVNQFDFSPYEGQIDLLAAGAPCQPFSLAGKHRGHRDARNMFPEVFRAVREIRPGAVVVENVRGLLRKSFRSYFDYIILQLSHPEVLLRRSETWQGHKKRLEKLSGTSKPGALSYRVEHQLVNAADFGVPQRRERVFIVAFREDLDLEWAPLRGTYKEDALLHDQWVSGHYWEQHELKMPPTPSRIRSRVGRLESLSRPLIGEPWRTVRDALQGLPEPKDRIESMEFLNHVGNPGARSYPGHTGSPWDYPAKTLKAGDHGVPGGENMLRREDGSIRYFTVREAARLQTFPDEFAFSGAWSEGFRQLGNAVPVDLAASVTSVIGTKLRSRMPRRSLQVA